MKRVKKIFLITIICIIAISSINIVIAGSGIQEVIDIANKGEPGIPSATKFVDFINVIIGGIQLIGNMVSILVLIILGIKYMIGSAEQRSEYKSTMIPYLIGATLLFATTNLLSIIYKIATGVGTATIPT